MSSSTSTSCLLIFIFFLVFPLSSATTDDAGSKIVSSEKLLGSLVGNVVTTLTSAVNSLHNDICKTAPDPEFCKKILPHVNNTDIFFYGRFVVEESEKKSKRFVTVIDNFKKKSGKAVPALDDCKDLAELNDDFVTTSYSKLKDTSKTLPLKDSDDVETHLSAMMTNQQACLDSMDEMDTPADVKSGVFSEIDSDRKLFGVSLSIFKQGWAPPKKNLPGWKPPPSVHRFALNHGEMSLKMSKHWHHVFQKVSGRRHCLEAEEGTVKIAEIVAVKKDGTGNFTTITEAVEAAPKNNDGKNGYFMIYVGEGIYEEYVNIPKHKTYLMMIGDGINKTIITGNRSNRGGWTTFKSATFTVTSPNFVAVNITFRNTAGPEGHQAVAVRNGADLSTFYMCSFEGYQDTLYAFSLRQFYRECDIYGTVDYIFGNAAVVFQNCNIYSRLPMPGQKNAVTAQGRVFENQNTGTSIINCTITAAPDLAASPGTTKTYLGRPWKEFSRTLIMNSFIDAIVDPTGWEPWNETFALQTLYYAEYQNKGPGAATTARVNWPGYHAVADLAVAANFTVTNFIDGDEWLPMTGVPYQGGLL